MCNKSWVRMLLAGAAAGTVTGLFGAGGGMILVPALSLLTDLEENEIFPASLAIILPVCLVSLTATAITGTVAWQEALPYLAGSAVGGFLAGKWGRKIPAVWLHRLLGGLILWGGIRYLC